MTNDKTSKYSSKKKPRRGGNILNLFGIGLVVIAVGAVVVGLIQQNNTQIVGELVPIMSSVEHHDGVEIEYNTSPPTSGEHYSNPIPAGFYDENSFEASEVAHPESYIVHSLEHGYVVVWYNCANLDAAECSDLKADIKNVVDENPEKVIVFPWADMEEPVVLTAWGIIMRLDEFDADSVRSFIKANKSNPRAPEANVP